MILTAHQPLYLPYLAHFAKIAQSDIFVLLDSVEFSRSHWFSRNRIRTSDGSQWLTVPTLTKGKSKQFIKDVKIDNTKKWKRTHLKAIELSYCKAPCFDIYHDFLVETYNKNWNYLIELNEYLLRYFLKMLGIKINIVKLSEIGKIEGKKSSLMLNLCKKMNADVFIFGKTGKEYVNESDFKSSNIKVIFQNYIHPTYPQIHGNFIPNMSIIDLLFNCGPKSFEILMGQS